MIDNGIHHKSTLNNIISDNICPPAAPQFPFDLETINTVINSLAPTTTTTTTPAPLLPGLPALPAPGDIGAGLGEVQ